MSIMIDMVSTSPASPASVRSLVVTARLFRPYMWYSGRPDVGRLLADFRQRMPRFCM